MDAIHKDWFSEMNDLWPGQCFSLKVSSIVHSEKSQYQDILIVDTTDYARVLILDGVIQCTIRDEFSYQEMMAFVPINCCPDPANVLIVGGGDGGVARELLKDPRVGHVTVCEIDERVTRTCEQHMPSMVSDMLAAARQDVGGRLTLVFRDGVEFLREHTSYFDVIITDSSDPIGPASCLFGEEYYRCVHNALRPGGVACSQGENIWIHQKLIKDVLSTCSRIFASCAYSYTTIPSYPGGQIGLILCSKQKMNFSTPFRILSNEEMDSMSLRYYTPQIHTASFVLPRFASNMLKSIGIIDG